MTAFLTTRDLQDLIKVDKSTIYRMADDGRLPALKVGRQWRFPAAEIDAWLAGGALPAPPPTEASPDGLQDLADLLGRSLEAMVLITDFDGRPLTTVANPCGLFTAVASDPAGIAHCLAAWRRYSDEPGLAPRFHTSAFGFLCARAFARVGDRLAAMVIAGGIAPETWPPGPDAVARIAAGLHVPVEVVADHLTEIHPGGPEMSGGVLGARRRAGGVASSLLGIERSTS
jgi:excisionase family DNA binding protein